MRRNQVCALVCRWMLLAAFGCGVPTAVMATPDQPPTGFTGAARDMTCLVCHYGGERTGSAALDFGQGASGYEAGGIYQIAITISDPVAIRFGFSMVARSPSDQDVGTFSPLGPNTSTQGSHVNHLNAPAYEDAPGTHTFTVEWQAPATAPNPVTFYFAANAANGDDTSSGDSIYFGSLIVPRHDLPNIPPTVTVPDVVVSATTAESIAIPVIIVEDPDAGAAAVSVTLQVENGTIHVDEEIAGGLAAGAIENNHSENVRLTGSLAAINTTLAAEGALRYTSHAGFAGPDSLRVEIDDKGNTGSGGALTAEATVAIDVNYLSFTLWQAATFGEETPEADKAPDADPDQDQRSNALEFFAGTDPLAQDFAATEMEASEQTFSAIFPRSKRIDPALGQPLWGSDLASWSADGLTVTLVEDLSPTVELVRVTVPRHANADERSFIVWRVRLPEFDVEDPSLSSEDQDG